MIFNQCRVVRLLALPLLLSLAVSHSSYAQDATPHCVDTDGDGWGWDGAASCRIQPITCVDTDGDGWGWDGESSCSLTEDIAPQPEFSTEFCTDTDGDDWGWNGTETCLIDAVVDNICIDTDGDGWGWNGESSCLIDTQSGCIDTDGDGWGWNGYQSCLITDPSDEGPSNTNTCSINGIEVNTEIDQLQCDALLDIYASTNGNSWYNNSQWASPTDPCSWFGVSCVDDMIYELELTDNNLTGPIPDGIGSLHALTALRLSDNQLTGTIPVSIGNLSNLEVLYFSDNQLSGSIPPEIASLNNLAVLNLADNAIDGVIPDAIGDMNSLAQLFLDANYLSGSIPPGIGNLPSLEILDLHSNLLSGEIPDTFSNSDLILFNASNNQLGGDLDNIATTIINNGTFLILHSNQCFTTTNTDLAIYLNGFGPPHWNDGCL